MPGMIDVRLLGGDELQRALARAPGVVHRHFFKAMKKVIYGVQAKAQRYPPAPPESSYVRTGTLGRRWTTHVEARIGFVKGRAENLTPYGPFVMGTDDQAWMHAGRWKTEEQIAKEYEPEANRIFSDALDDIVKEIEKAAKH